MEETALIRIEMFHHSEQLAMFCTDPSLLDDQWNQTMPEKLPLPFCGV